jgi:hypothetical protein
MGHYIVPNSVLAQFARKLGYCLEHFELYSLHSLKSFLVFCSAVVNKRNIFSLI